MRNLKKSEEIILLILTAALIGLFYFQFVYKGVIEARSQYDTSLLETQLTIYQAKLASMKSMEQEIESGKNAATGMVATYNNQKQEIIALNNIFAEAETFDFNFAAPQAVEGDTTVRREVSAAFTAASYEKARQMLNDLYHCEYRCLIGDITMNPSGSSRDEDSNLANGPVQVSFTVTFFETLYGAESQDGINFLDADNG